MSNFMEVLRTNRLPESEAPPKTPYTKLYDYDGSGNLIYEGFSKSVNNAATSAALWAIKQYAYATVAGSSVVSASKWAQGGETKVWDSRAGYTYQ